MAKIDINEADLIENPAPRVPVSLCIDTSGSMQGEKINELLAGINMFYESVREDEDARDAAEISVVEFNSGATLIQDFTNIDRVKPISNIQANGATFMGEGVNLALDALERRKKTYSDNGVQYFQPWLVLMTDGQPNGNQSILLEAVERTSALVNGKKLTVFPIGIGNDADMTTLARFSPSRPPLRLKGLAFREFFQWLSKSVSSVSQSTPGDVVKLDTAGIAGWGEI